MGLLILLTTIGGFAAAAVLLVYAFWKNLAWLRKFVLGAVAIWFFLYLVLLLGTSFFSREETLGRSEPKSFCGVYLDCHMHAAVTGVRKAATIGDRPARGEFYIVRVRVFSDAKRARLGLAAVDANVVDQNRRKFVRDREAEARLGKQPRFDRRIMPTESFEKQIVFDLPADAENPRLDIREGSRIERLLETVLIGDEDSFWHKRRFFGLTDRRIAEN